ncbi:hypothetical protein [Halorussus halophilus]|uniref:hypothetical protein n=1 Tax=Halorussus halophilus TaxID=2650975 RepID=UPI0013016176|nr:hypothetical protein [Halorussus halophilus]
MVSKAFFTGSRYLVEDNDGRQDYLRYNGERFLQSLATAGQWVADTPIDADEAKTAYLKALVTLNDAYFEARQYEDSAKGNFFKHDETAERRFRITTAERLTDAIENLRTLFSAHDALLSAIENANETAADSIGSELRTSLLAHTDQAIAAGWFPTVRAYFYSLTPGENISEGRERRKQRVVGSETLPGLDELLGKFTFEKLTDRDMRRIRTTNQSSPGPDTGTWQRLKERYAWLVERGALRSSPDDCEDTNPRPHTASDRQTRTDHQTPSDHQTQSDQRTPSN